MALTKISTGGVKDDAASQAIIADEAVDEARLQISNAGSNGQFLSKQSGNTGGLTWATPPDTNTQVGGATGVDFNDDVKARFGTGNDLEIYHNGSHNFITASNGNLNLTSDLTQFQTVGGETALKATADGAVELRYDDVKKFETTSTGVTISGSVTDDKGNVRSIPKNNQSSAYTLVAADAGKCVMQASGGVTIPASVFSTGDAVTIINDSGSNQTLTQASGVSMFNSADASLGNRTLAGRGMATIWWSTATTCYISGSGLS